MKKLVLALASFLISPMMLLAQKTIFSEDFSHGLNPNIVIRDVDGAKVQSLLSDYPFGEASPWIIVDHITKDGKNAIDNPAIIAASYLENDAPANDYLIFKNISLPNSEHITLSWDALSGDVNFLESYDVYVYEGANDDPNNIKNLEPVVKVDNERGATTDPATGIYNNWAKHSFDLSQMKGKSISICFHLRTTSGFFLVLDNVKVEAEDEAPLVAPIAETFKIDAKKKTEATVRWSKVKNATKYTVSVYSRGELPTDQREFVVQDAEVENPIYKVVNLASDKRYFVRVKSIMNDKTSEESVEIPIVQALDSINFPSPTSFSLQTTTDNQYFLDASPVGYASSYRFNCFSNEVASEAKDYVFHEDFSGSTKGTLDNPVDVSMFGAHIDDISNVKGWGGNILGLVDGGVLINNRFKGQYWSYLDCPIMTLGSSSNGHFTLKLDVMGKVGDEVVVNLYKSKHNQTVELLEALSVTLAKDEEAVTLNFTKGAASSFVSIEVHTNSSDRAVIKDIKIERSLAKGDKMKLLRKIVYTQLPHVSIPQADLNIQNATYYTFTAQGVAIHRKKVFTDESKEVYSDSKYAPAGIQPLVVEKIPKICATSDGFHISFEAETVYSVYSLDGVRLITAKGFDANVKINRGDARILVVGDKSYKLVR